MRSQGQRRLRRLMARPLVNRPLTHAVRPFAGVLTKDMLRRVPVVGVVEVRSSPSSEPVLMGNDGNDPVASLLFWRGLDGWEPATLSVFLRLVSPGSTVVDVGANSGLFSLLAASHDPTVRVHAVEPVGRVFSVLESNVALNHLNNVTCHRLALSDVSGPVSLHVPDEPLPVMASLRRGWCTDVVGEEIEEVDCVTLDGLVETLDEGRVDLVKIDAEGSEGAVLRGGVATLSEHRPFIVCEVLDRGHGAEAVGTTLAGAGYRSFALTRGGPRPCDRIGAGTDDETHNYLFVHRTRCAEMGSRT